MLGIKFRDNNSGNFTIIIYNKNKLNWKINLRMTGPLIPRGTTEGG